MKNTTKLPQWEKINGNALLPVPHGDFYWEFSSALTRERRVIDKHSAKALDTDDIGHFDPAITMPRMTHFRRVEFTGPDPKADLDKMCRDEYERHGLLDASDRRAFGLGWGAAIRLIKENPGIISHEK